MGYTRKITLVVGQQREGGRKEGTLVEEERSVIGNNTQRAARGKTRPGGE